jgi:hypothetical protein
MAGRGRRNSDEVLIMALGAGATHEAAAQQAGVSRETVRRRLKDPEFRQRLQDQGADMLRRSAGAMSALCAEAIRTLYSLLGNTVPHAVRHSAARTTLEFTLRLRESTDSESRIAALEQLFAQRAGQTGTGQWPERASTNGYVG